MKLLEAAEALGRVEQARRAPPAALTAGFGVGVCQAALGKRDGLVAVLPGALSFELGVWLVMHEDLRATRRVRLMFEHLAAGLRGYIESQPRSD